MDRAMRLFASFLMLGVMLADVPAPRERFTPTRRTFH
jgi:hypothetical protein